MKRRQIQHAGSAGVTGYVPARVGRRRTAVLTVVALTTSASLGAAWGRAAATPSGAALADSLIKPLIIAGYYGVPDDAEMVAVNVTAVSPVAPGHITAFACDEDLPTASNVNYNTDDVVPNMALVRIGADGDICLATHAATDIVVDVIGYVPTGSAIQALPNPVRVRDTRRTGGPIRAGTAIEVGLTGPFGIPSDADTVMMNLTAVLAEGPGHATVYPCSARAPGTSSLNYVPGRTVANFVVAPVRDGKVCIRSHATAHVVVDVAAYTTGGFVALPAPVRLRDTRRERSTPLPTKSTTAIDVRAAGVPATAKAAVYNLTADRAVAPGHATSFPCDELTPTTSNLNYVPGRPSANGTITKLSGRTFCVYVHSATHLIVDLIGYTANEDHYVAVTPERVWDSRLDDDIVCGYAYRIDGPRSEVLDLWTRTWRSIPLPNELVTNQGGRAVNHAVTRGDCATAWLVATVGGREGVFEVRPTGTYRFVRSLPAREHDRPHQVLRTGEGGELLASSSEVIYDALTGDPISIAMLTTPELRPEVIADSSRDGLTALIYFREQANGGGHELGDLVPVVYDMIYDEILSSVDGAAPALSPSGLYVMSLSRSDNSTRIEVRTRYGDVVARRRFGGWAEAVWTGVGDLLVCTRHLDAPNGYHRGAARRVYDWRIFTEPQLLVAEHWDLNGTASMDHGCDSFAR